MDFSGISLDLSSLSKRKSPNPEEVYDCIILGGGPAALTAAVYAARKLLKLALITRDFGGQVKSTSEIENYLGYQTITGQELVNKFVDHVDKFEVLVQENATINKVDQKENQFWISTKDETVFQSHTIVYATGKRHRLLNVPGEQALMGKGIAFCAICDAPFYKDKNVVVVGGGNSGFTAAVDLLKVAIQVTLINNTPGFKADEILIKAVKKYDHVELLDNHSVISIEGRDKVELIRVLNKNSNTERTIPTDGVFIQVGLDPNTEPIKALANLSPYHELIVDCHCRTNVPGLFGAGDVTTVPYDQIIISAGEGAKAALSAYDYLLKNGLI